MMKKLFLSALFAGIFLITELVMTADAQAGMVELGASASYRKSTITSDNYSTSESYTGSFAYYFSDSTALELSYTEGFSRAVAYDAATATGTETRAYFTIYGIDFIYTMGTRENAFRPYLKVGGAYVYKDIRYTQTGFPDPLPPVKSAGWAPSAGFGFRLMMTQNLAIKIGVEGQTSPIEDTQKKEGEKRPVVYDFAGRAGISWMF